MILASFTDPQQACGPDKIIPREILTNAKGIAILTVTKAGFLGPAGYGNGVVVARADGPWSAPSALGIGVTGQIGIELTDLLLILNDQVAVCALSQARSTALGGNVTVAAGPVGRDAKAPEGYPKSFEGIFSYSKIEGVFAGVTMDITAVFDRTDKNEKFYGQREAASQVLGGAVKLPPESEPLMDVLNSPLFTEVYAGGNAMCLPGEQQQL